MRQRRPVARTKRRSAAHPARDSSAGRKTVSLAPPDCGIDFVDRSSGMPDGLRSGLERLSGIDLSAVRVHYNSDKPAQLQARAYTKGPEIHLAPGEERHLAHEGWHAVQQLQGRVPATGAINEDQSLEREADEMGARAREVDGGPRPAPVARPLAATGGDAVVQRVKWGKLALGVAGAVGSLGLGLLHPGLRRYIRDAWRDEVVLAEEQARAAQSGQTIRYTPLAAGCMAVTVLFNGGGGAGVHMAMMPQGATQWADLVNAIGASAVSQVFVDTEFVDEQQGWYVGGGGGPRSYYQLTVVDGLDDPHIHNAGWRYDANTMQQWFAQAFGVGIGAVQISQNTTPSHAIP